VSYAAIDRHRRGIEQTLARAKVLDPGSAMRADLAKYVCVLASGYIEQTTKALVLVHCSNRGVTPSVQRYVERQLKRFQNAETSRIFDLLNALDPMIEASFRATVTPERESAVDSVVHLRHQIAHGGQATTSIDQQEQYLQLIEQFLIELRTRLA
jgi:hypothetical protein